MFFSYKMELLWYALFWLNHVFTFSTAEPEAGTSDDEDKDEDADEEEGEKSKTKTVKETVYDWEVLNDVKAIWLRSPREITEEEYIKFYHSIAKVNCYMLSSR